MVNVYTLKEKGCKYVIVKKDEKEIVKIEINITEIDATYSGMTKCDMINEIKIMIAKEIDKYKDLLNKEEYCNVLKQLIGLKINLKK